MIIELLVLVNLWCDPAPYEEEFLSCRQELTACVKRDYHKHKKMTEDSLRCFEEFEFEDSEELLGC